MYYEDESGALNFVAGMLIGAVLGASIALLAAPNTGKKTRRRLIKAVSGVADGATERFDDITGDVRSAVRAGRKRVRL